MSKLDELTNQALTSKEAPPIPIKLSGMERFLGAGFQTTTPQVLAEEDPLTRLTREALQAMPRAILSTALTVAPKKVKESLGEIKPEELGETGRFFLGERPIRPIEREIAETELGLKEPLGKFALPAAFAIGFGGTLIDIAIPGGKASFLKQLAKTTDKDAMKGLLMKGIKDISESEAGNLAVKLAPITDAKLIEKELNLFKSVKETIPEIPVSTTKGIANEAVKFAKENPESSLVAKEFRNPRTKELESGPLLFRRIGESLRNGEINIDDLPDITKKYGLNAEDTARLFEDAATYSGRTLQALSRVEKELRALLPDIKLPERIPTLWERFKSGYLAVDNFRRGLLVTQLATAARNAISQAGRYTLGTITDGMNGIISKITGKGEGFIPFFEDIAAVLRKFERGNVERLQGVLRKNPIENARLYNTPVGDVALTGKITNTLNAFNRGQEYFFRNLILDAKLNAAAKFKEIPIEKLGMDDIEKAVSEALEWTYAKSR